MQQYFKVKAKYPDAILLFRVGDFYETFGEDAVKASQVLGIVLTNRNNGGSQIELAGFPYHSVDTYLPRLVKAGFRVAICEQLEKPSPHKKIVRRGVTEVVTPGLAMDDKMLDLKSNNYLAALSPSGRDRLGLAFLDISTGEFLVCQGDWSYAEKLLQSLQPAEIIFPKDKRSLLEEHLGDGFHLFPLEDWVFTEDFGREKLLHHFEVQTLKGFGVEELGLAQISAGAILHYMASTENNKHSHVNRIRRLQPENFVWLDRFTIRNLELLHSQHETGVPLVRILDHTISPMGARLLKKWMVLPLKNKADIDARLEVVSHFIEHPELCEHLEGSIRKMGDLERLISKVPSAKINPREVNQLRRALEAIEPMRKELMVTKDPYLTKIGDAMNPCKGLQDRIREQLIDDPPVNLSKGGVIADGFNAELDEQRGLMRNSKDLLLGIQQKEAAATGIDNLKIGFNNVFGYYLEVTNKYKNKDVVPPEWVRKQTLTNAERYITDELKHLEQRILGAEEKILDIEERLYQQLVLDLVDYIQPVQHNAALVARLDCLLSFARVAQKQQYCRPQIDEEYAIDIREGRHPVIEQQLTVGESYVPNDVYLSNDEQQIMLITGPNMSGKSALLRQTALICLMAQMGSFVPAKQARIGLLDKIFVRVGASDNISSGESTFMVEMNETASILNNLSARSLILLDEIGRGTSTYDGISIAWSIAEFLHNHPTARAKTLFATHYHELNELEAKFPRIKNYNVSVREIGQQIIFLRTLKPGGSAHSFGIHVARMAGMPKELVQRANQILKQLEEKAIGADLEDQGKRRSRPQTSHIEPAASLQLSIFETVDPKAGQLRQLLNDLDLNAMTPLDCMLKLKELIDLANS
jgi:DNA mismatch repair protein MutS